MPLELCLLPELYSVAQIKPNSPIPDWAVSGNTWAVVKTEDELSVVCCEYKVPDGIRSERGWRIIKVVGPLEFSLVGILAGLAGVLAEAGISIFAISTYDTDYVLVKEHQLEAALEACCQSGYIIHRS